MFPQELQKLLIEKFQLEDAPQDELEKFLKQFEELVQNITVTCILEGLNAQDKEQFVNILKDDESGEKALDFANSKIPELQVKISQKIKEQIDYINS